MPKPDYDVASVWVRFDVPISSDKEYALANMISRITNILANNRAYLDPYLVTYRVVEARLIPAKDADRTPTP